MHACPKCSSYRISGPRYENRRWYEVLIYTCNRCGYSETRPTDDAQESSPEFLPKASTKEVGIK